jgi:cell wall-associated NlpC family hydrolase
MGTLRKAAIGCFLALLVLLSCASASAAGDPRSQQDDAALGTLGETVLGVIASSTNADEALGSLGQGLALMEASERVEAEAETREKAAAAAAKLDPPGPVVPGDPSTLPPASAGSNGTKVLHHSSADRAKIFANMRAGGGVSTSILLTGIALPPPDAPQAVKDVINNANMIIGRPYVWGGGHGSWYSYGYDCSGSVSFALFGGGMIPRPLTSGELEGWGAPGPGRWITVYANAGHTFAEIAGLRFDTSGTESGTGPRWHLGGRPTDGYVVRHPPGF